MRNYISGLLTGLGLGVGLVMALESKAGWPPGDGRFFLLITSLVFAGVVVDRLGLARKKRDG